jgi:nitrogen-specific signal transduction histidine kinase
MMGQEAVPEEMGDDMRDATLARKELQTFLNSLATPGGPGAPVYREDVPPNDGRSTLSQLPFLEELIHHVKGSLSAMKTFAFLSRDRFKDAELGEHFYRIISEDVEKTLSVLGCYCDYLRFNAPVSRKDTVRTLIEEALEGSKEQMKEKNIGIIKKQFESDLPETTVPDAALRYVLETLIQYAIHTLPRYGGLGFLTRPYDRGAGDGHGLEGLQKDGCYIEILMVSTHHEKQGHSSEVPEEVPAARNGTATGLMLELVKEVVRKNRGVMRIKAYDEKAMTFYSLVLPVERRKVVRFPAVRVSEKKLDG